MARIIDNHCFDKQPKNKRTLPRGFQDSSVRITEYSKLIIVLINLKLSENHRYVNDNCRDRSSEGARLTYQKLKLHLLHLLRLTASCPWGRAGQVGAVRSSLLPAGAIRECLIFGLRNGSQTVEQLCGNGNGNGNVNGNENPLMSQCVSGFGLLWGRLIEYCCCP